MMYLLIGEDELAKQEKIQSLKKQLFPPELEPFNYDVFSAKELTLPLLTQALGRIPVRAKNRLLVIKDMLKLKSALQEYCVNHLKAQAEKSTIVFDVGRMPEERNIFLSHMLKITEVAHFKTAGSVNAFSLARAIEKKNADSALVLLADLFKAGEKAERILGGLRYQLVKQSSTLEDKRKKVNFLLETDVNLKTGKLKPEFALEMLVVKLCR